MTIYMLKKDATGVSMKYDDKVPVCISDYALRLLLPPQLKNITQCHEIMYC